VNIIILLTIINLYQHLEINTIIVDQLLNYFSSVVTGYIYGNDTIDESNNNIWSHTSYGSGIVFRSLGR